MSKSFQQNIPEIQRLAEMNSEELAGYVLEHLHTITEGKSHKFHAGNLALEISRGYPVHEQERVSDAVRQGCQLLKNHDFIYERTNNGFFDFTKKGQSVTTAAELLASLSAPSGTGKQATNPAAVRDRLKTPAKNFPRIPLSEAEELWLRAVYSRLLSGNKVNPIEIMIDLLGEIPDDFNYKGIDRRLLLFGVDITLLGILHVDPTTELVEKTDRVIGFIRDLIKEQPDIENVSAEQVAQAIQLPFRDVSIVFSLLRHLGKYWSGGSGDERGMTSVSVNYEEVKREYLKYKGIEILLDKLYKDSGADEYGEATGLSGLEPRGKPAGSFLTETLNTQMNTDVQDKRNVFVVHGRNIGARRGLFAFLRSIGLRPLEWSQAIQMTGKASPFIGEILDEAFIQAQAVVVLMTPDDVAQLQEPYRSESDPPYEAQLTGQARPNVLFEAGMAMGRNPHRTVIVEIGTLRPFSDIAGRHTVKLSNDSVSRQELAQRLETAGCPVDLSGRDWHTEGDFNLNTTSPSAVSSSSTPTQLDEHDRLLFTKFLTEFPSEGKAARFLRDYDIGGSFPAEMLNPLNDFVNQWGNAEHEFNNPEMEEKRINLWNALNSFLRDLGQYTSEKRLGWLSIGLEDMENRPEMLDAQSRLNALGTKVYEAHQNLVREGRRHGAAILVNRELASDHKSKPVYSSRDHLRNLGD